jgi:hypothetical protein
MTLAKRLDQVEDNLTPQEAIMRWMREAHEFGSYEAYARWLIDQPDDVYPLIHMPHQVVGAVRAQNKGVPDIKLRSEFRRVQKDVLFLYFLHKQAQMRALMDHEATQLRVIILIKEIRALINEKHSLDQMRLARVDLGGRKHPRPGKVETSTRADYTEHVAGWLPEADAVVVRILTFLAAAHMISHTYFAREDILFPATRENLAFNLETIANLKEMHADSLLGAPQTDDDFRDYVLGLARGPKECDRNTAPPVDGDVPDVTAQSRVMAEQWVLMARSETLEKLGEHRDAEALAQKLLRQAL